MPSKINVPDYQSIERGAYKEQTANNDINTNNNDEKPVEGHGHGGLNTKAAAVLIAGEMAGSGVLAIPKAVVDAGWMGLVMVAVLCGNAWFCATKLGVCWEIIEERYPEQRQFSRNPYPTIANKASGKFASLLVSGCMQVTLFGAGVVYLLMASQIVQDLFHPLLPNVTFCSWFVLFSLIIIPPMWLGSPKDFWVVGVGALVTTACACVFMVAQIILDWNNPDLPTPEHKVKGLFPFFLSFGVIMFAFGGASTFPTIQNDMVDKSKFKKSAIIGFIVILILYFPVALGGYMVYGDAVSPNIVLSLGRGPLVTTANICMAMHLILAFLIVVNPICQEIENILDVPREFCLLRCIVRTAMVLVMLVIGETVPDFSKLLSLVGGSTIALATFVLPNYFYLKLCDQQSPLWPKRISSDNNNDGSTEILHDWLGKNGQFYHGYKAVLDDESKGYDDEISPSDWSLKRYQHVISLREEALRAAKAQWADYLWVLDADTFITDPKTLSELISKGFTTVAPMLLSDGLYSNFWGGMTDGYYYRRTDEYLEILNRKKSGCFEVPMIHSAVLIDLRMKHSEQLTYDPDKIPDYNGPRDDIISFAVSATKEGIPLMVCNEHIYGFMMTALEKDQGIDYDLEQLRNLKLEALNFGPGLNTTNDLEKWIRKPLQSHEVLSLHRVYVISLARREERRSRMNKCLQELGISATVFDAVDGKSMTGNTLEDLSIHRMPTYEDPYHKRPMKKGEIGCFLSHLAIWNEIISDEPFLPVLILEDDIRFEPFFRQKLITVLKEASRLPFQWDLIYLGRKKINEEEEEQVGGLGILVKAGYSYWTIGYLISLQGAQKLVEAKPLDNLVPVDEYIPILSDQHPRSDWKEYFDKRDLNVLSSKPLLLYPLLYSNEEGYVSDTEDSDLVSEELRHDEF